LVTDDLCQEFLKFGIKNTDY